MTIEAGTTTDFTYKVRSSALEPCLSWRLTADALVCEEAHGKEEQIGSRQLSEQWSRIVPYSEIASIRLTFDPTRLDTKRYRCALQVSNGVGASIVSTSYTGFASFEDHGKQYALFVRELVRRVQMARPLVKITTGLSWPSYILQHGFVLVALILLVTMLGIAGIPALDSAFVKLAIVVLYCGVLWRYAWFNRPRDLTLPLPD